MQVSKIILISGCLAGLTLSGWSQDASATAAREAPDAQATTTPTFTVLYDFGTKAGDPEGLFPPGFAAQGRDGNIYSTSATGGTNNDGTVFKIDLAGTLAVLHDFDGADGAVPDSGLTLGTDGNFYGTASAGGPNPDKLGNVFKTSSTGNLTVLYNFGSANAGYYPFAPPIQAEDGNFYGTTSNGGASAAYGSVYRITSGGELTTLAAFTSASGLGVYPFAPVVEAADGYFYGTSSTGGTGNDGVVFRVSRYGSHNVLSNFDGAHGSDPYGGLTCPSDGNCYGTTAMGGSQNDGVIFKITTSGVLAVLHNFGTETNDGIGPYTALVQASDGNFYGATYGGGANGDGTLFKLTPEGVYSIVHNFNGTDGSNPETTLLQHTNGIFYGTTSAGGPGTYGTFFSLNVGAPAFVRLVSTSGEVGSTVEILGQGFTSASKVSFGGVAATADVQSSTYLTAAVPSGALFGTVTVTTSGGTLSSNQQFRVVPVITSFEPTSGPPGTEVTIHGSGFTQTTNVTFDELEAASFTVNSDSQVTARVPSGAKTGPIAITRKGPGTGRSSEVFTVTK